ncbi:MAG TPA: hypothetical protein VES20_01625, partial [Bryobacteraceae bacterium]|nr:hypothetical protein [Bryobacteraceae bacterium]
AMPAFAQNPTADQNAPSAVENSYYPPQRWAGDGAVAKSAATSTYAQYFYENHRKQGYNFTNLRDGYVDITVPAYATWLFNVAFSAECRLFDKNKDKYKKYADNDALLIRVRVTNLRTREEVNLQPFDRDQAFCSDDSYATHKGNWVYTPFAGGNYPGGTTYRVFVSFLVYDQNRNDRLYGYIDDWTLEAVAYQNGRRVY